MSDIFCKIVNQEISSFTVYENSEFMAFLNINPLEKGHLLLIPKKHFETVQDMPEDFYSRYFLLAKELSIKLKNFTSAPRVTIAAIGLDIPHAHLHIIPTFTPQSVNFANEKPADMKELELLATELNNALNS